MSLPVGPSFAGREAELLAEFGALADGMDRYERIIALGRALPPLEEALRTDDRLVRGCQSRVWLDARLEGGRVILAADSDALITRGLVAILIRMLSGLPPRELLEAPLDFVERIGLREHLSPARSNGLASMVRQIRLHALAFRMAEEAGGPAPGGASVAGQQAGSGAPPTGDPPP